MPEDISRYKRSLNNSIGFFLISLVFSMFALGFIMPKFGGEDHGLLFGIIVGVFGMALPFIALPISLFVYWINVAIYINKKWKSFLRYFLILFLWAIPLVFTYIVIGLVHKLVN